MAAAATSSSAKRRTTTHAIVEFTSDEVFIVSSLQMRKDTQVIAVDPQSGSLHYDPAPGIGLFGSEAAAVEALEAGGSRSVRSVTRARALIGYFRAGSEAFLLLITQVRPDMRLHGKHTAYTVTETVWHRVRLRGVGGGAAVRSSSSGPKGDQTRADEKSLESMREFPIEGLHYFCETLDMTRPFPSGEPVARHDPEFCWNDWLAAPFARLGMREWCVVLLQGVALSRTFDFAPHRVTLGLVNRKSCVNPGTRYNARGLNTEGGPGNEMECELLLWMGAKHVQWSSFVWRRGTVPVWFRTELKSAASTQATMVIRENPYEGATQYYENLVNRFGRRPITCVNLLRCQPGHTETLLSEHFQDSIRVVKAELDFSIKLINFDWHSVMKHVGLDHTILGLWSQVYNPILNMGYTHGTLTLRSRRAASQLGVPLVGAGAVPVTPSGHVALADVTKRQDGIFRLNCADSLDRTNVSSFFVCIQVLAEMMRAFGLFDNAPSQGLPAAAAAALDARRRRRRRQRDREAAFEASETDVDDDGEVVDADDVAGEAASDDANDYGDGSGTPTAGGSDGDQDQVSTAAAPQGDRVDGDASPGNDVGGDNVAAAAAANDDDTEVAAEEEEEEIEWPFFQCSLPEMASLIPPDVLSCMADFFVTNGDTCSILYTNTQALHSHLLRDFAPHLPAAPNNTLLSVQRRYQNLVNDPERHAQYEMFLGRALETHFSPQSLAPLACLSRYPAYIDETAAAAGPPPNAAYRCTADMILADPNVRWLCPDDVSEVRLPIVLSRTAFVTELALTVRHDATSVYPAMVDLRMGETRDRLHFVFQGLVVPACKSGTVLRFTVPHGLAYSQENAELYDFEGGDPILRPAARFVEVTLRGDPSAGQLQFGHVGLFGYEPAPSRPPHESLAAFRKRLIRDDVDAVVAVLDPAIAAADRVAADVSSSSVRAAEDGSGGESPNPPADGDEAAGDTAADTDGSAPAAAITASPATPEGGNVEGGDDDDDGIVIEEADGEGGGSGPTRDPRSLEDRMAAYGEAVTATLGSAGRLTLAQTAELELVRLDLGLTPQQRDDQLVAMALRIQFFNPNRFVYPRDRALLSALGRNPRFHGEACPACDAQILLTAEQCHYCFRAYCRDCMAEARVKIREYCWLDRNPVCQACHDRLARTGEVLADITARVEVQRLFEHDAKGLARDLVLGAAQRASDRNRAVWAPEAASLDQQLALFPGACVANVPPAAPDSPPVEVVLFDPALQADHLAWSAPEGTAEAALVVSLSARALVTAVVLTVGPAGYTAATAPRVTVATCDTGAEVVHGVWDLADLLVDGSLAAGARCTYALTEAPLARTLSLTLALPEANAGDDGDGAADTRQLTVGRLAVLGTPLPHPVAPPPMTMPTFKPRLAWDVLKPRAVRYRHGKRVVDLTLELTPLHGFCLHVRHGEEGVASQVRTLRAMISQRNEAGEPTSQFLVGRFTVPKVAPNTRLYFQWERTVKGHTITFEALSNYGGDTLVPPKVTVF